MREDLISGIIDEYDVKCALYDEFTKVTEKLLRDLLSANNIRDYSITSRLKKRDSLKDKLRRSDSQYEKLSDVTDVSGIRIITYFADEVDDVASVITREFEVDPDNSVDKRAILDPDRFGYLSLHYVAKLLPSRLQLTEYRQFSDCNVEIQIRSILQHTWAEIEHDLGYKSKIAIPKQLRRRFYQLAGLLELADDEFSLLRVKISEYETDVLTMVSTTPDTVLIDKTSILAFLSKSNLLLELDQRICNATNRNLLKQQPDATDLVNRLVNAGFNTIADINSSLVEATETIVPFAVKIAGVPSKRSSGGFLTGVSLIYLAYIVVARIGNINQMFQFLGKAIPQQSPRKRNEFARELIKSYKEVLS